MTRVDSDFNTTEHDVLLGLGSNVGSDDAKLAALRAACSHLAGHVGIRLMAKSSVFRTPPWGKTDQPDFFNAAVRVATTLLPLELLDAVKTIENSMGRTPTCRWGPRIIDIDILLYDTLNLDTPVLTVPHRHLLDRDFACVPALEAAPDALLPGGTTLREAAANLTASSTIQRVDVL